MSDSVRAMEMEKELMRNNSLKKEESYVSVIIPVFNEGETIEKAVYYVGQVKCVKEIIVVDDGSTDKTYERLKLTNVKVIQHGINRGYGAALKTGIKNAIYDTVVIIDADGTYPNGRIQELVQTFEIGNHDMVIGARIGPDVKIPLIRKPAKWVISKLANYLSGAKILDLNSGLRVMKKEIVEKFIKILPDGFSFTSTITLAMLTNGYKVAYIPISYYKREGKSKIKPIKDTFNFIQLITRTVLYFNPLKVFIPLSLLLVLFAFLVLLGGWLLLGKIMDVSFGVILMSAVIVIAIGMLADLIDKRMKD